MRKIVSIGYVTFLFLLLGCDPKKEEPIVIEPPLEQDFTCIKLFDEVGQDLGIHGSCTTSDDWGKITLKTWEQAFLNFADTVSLTGTVASTISKIGIAPNPVKIDQALRLYVVGTSSNPSYKVKLAIVDESLKVIQQVAVKLQGGNGIAIWMDPAKFESGKYYRLYYKVSANGAPSLFEGYGNFLVCKTYIDGVNTTIESDCL
jgi:hypothetical protein